MATKLQFLAVASAILCTQALGVTRHLRTAHRVAALQDNATSAKKMVGQRAAAAPCACQASSASWVPASRTSPQCVFIDLGAANGNTYAGWLSNQFGDISACPSGRYEAHLVEANPRFAQPLKTLQDQNSAVVHSHAPTAAYMCNGETSFFIDNVNHDNNYWGSSMSPNHQDVVRSGHQQVTVPTVNVIQLVAENTIPQDYVVVKMDIEGAEWDILPCLAHSPAASLIDKLLIEVHPANLGHIGTTQWQLDAAISELRNRGVQVPSYSSPTL